MSACPICCRAGHVCPYTGYVDGGVCPDCAALGYEEAGCGCVTRPDGTLMPCSRHQEPTDDQTMNGHWIEGGIRYDRAWEQR